MLYALAFLGGLLYGAIVTGYMCCWAISDTEQLGWDW